MDEGLVLRAGGTWAGGPAKRSADLGKALADIYLAELTLPLIAMGASLAEVAAKLEEAVKAIQLELTVPWVVDQAQVREMIVEARESLRAAETWAERRELDEFILMLTWALWGIGERKVKAREWLKLDSGLNIRD